MPELPEVEHTRRKLVRWMQGARIEAVQTEDKRIAAPSPKKLVAGLTGRTVTKVERIGKWLRFLLDDDQRVFCHLGMTGWFEPSKPGAAPLRFERVGFDLVKKRGGTTKKSRVSYVDSRRWGKLILAAADIPTWQKLGPDPLDAGIDLDRLAKKVSRRKTASIKVTLMDQTVLAGVGNIQAIEGLWKAKIDPRSHAAKMSTSDLKAIAAGLHWTIERTLDDLAVNELGEGNPFKIYGHKGEPCPRCKHTLKRIELGGRTTTYCPGCQVLKK